MIAFAVGGDEQFNVVNILALIRPVVIVVRLLGLSGGGGTAEAPAGTDEAPAKEHCHLSQNQHGANSHEQEHGVEGFVHHT